MSGGYFEYNCFRISQFADDLKMSICENGKLDKDGCGNNFSSDTIALLNTSQQIIDVAARLAKEIEWLYSDDIGEDSFSESVGRILGGLD